MAGAEQHDVEAGVAHRIEEPARRALGVAARRKLGAAVRMQERAGARDDVRVRRGGSTPNSALAATTMRPTEASPAIGTAVTNGVRALRSARGARDPVGAPDERLEQQVDDAAAALAERAPAESGAGARPGPRSSSASRAIAIAWNSRWPPPIVP